MTSRKPFQRKILYGVCIVVLLLPLLWLSQPATGDAAGASASSGGLLARLREKHQLSPAQLGEIDPTSVTIKLATLGMRGIAANLLWEKANEYFVKKDWTNRAAVLNQITKIQPNFVNVWLHQAWNVSYNISVQFDDYRDRYRWIVKGFDFLQEGIQYNSRQPRLQWELGFMISQKIGRADEAKFYRVLFKQDDDFHGSRPLAERDNWLVGKEWYEEAVKMVDEQGASMMGKGPLIYRSSAPMCLMNYSADLEKDGTFGEVARSAWSAAEAGWRRYGDVDIAGAIRGRDPVVFQLNAKEFHDQSAKKLLEELDALQPGLREKLVEAKRKTLTDAQREALDTPPAKRKGPQARLAAEAEEALRVSHDEIAGRVPSVHRKKAMQLAREAVRHEELSEYIDSQREIVNFVYWRTRAEMEQTENALVARRNIYRGDRAFAEDDLQAALDAYNQGLEAWRRVFDQYPQMREPGAEGKETMDIVRQYRRILNQLDKPFPEKFILQDVVELQESQGP